MVTLICKDKHTDTVVEGLKCLRVFLSTSSHTQTMFNDSRVHMLDIHDWTELIQLLLFPTIKDTLNNLMSLS